MMITELKGYVKATRVTVSRVTALILALAVLCAGTAFAASPATYNVDIYDGTEVTRVSTFKTDAEAIVKQAGVAYSNSDALDLGRFNVGSDSIITVYRSADIEYIDIDGKENEMIFAGTVGGLLDSLGVVLNEDTLVNLPTKTVLKDGMTVRLQNAYHVTVTADGVTQDVVMGEGTVADALNKAGITVGENDAVEPAPESAVYDAVAITVFRIEYASRTERETIAYSKKTVNSNEMYVGTTKVTQKGSNGLADVTYMDMYVDGQYLGSSEKQSDVIKEAVDQITTVGTKERALNIATIKNGGTPISELAQPSSLTIENGVPTSYKSVVTGRATAYTYTGSRTASGVAPMPGYVAVDPNQFPYGTKLWIVSTDGIVYGYAIAADTGGFVNRGKTTVDLFMNTESQCNQWGARGVVIYVL